MGTYGVLDGDPLPRSQKNNEEAHRFTRGRNPTTLDTTDSCPYSSNRNASKACTRCVCEDVREMRGQFECPECGVSEHADKTGTLDTEK